MITGIKTSQHSPNAVGYIRATLTITKGCEIAKFN